MSRPLAVEFKHSVLTRLLVERATRLDEAAAQVLHTCKEERRRDRDLAVAARRQLREQGIPSPGADVRGPSRVQESPLLPDELVNVDDLVMKYVRAVESVASRLREPSMLGTACFKFTASRLRKKRLERTGERTDTTECARRLIQWLAVAGATKSMSADGIAEAHLDPQRAHVIASMHLDCSTTPTARIANCSGIAGCRVMAVSRALSIVVQGLDTALRSATRRLANVAFDVAGDLKALVRRVEGENPGLVVGTLDKLFGQAILLEELDVEIRRCCLTSFYDLAPRGQRPRQAILIDATMELAEGGLTDAEIAELLDDGFPNVARREHRVAGLLRAKPSLRRWQRFARPATQAQQERARREPTIEWLAGRPYRRTGVGSFEPA